MEDRVLKVVRGAFLAMKGHVGEKTLQGLVKQGLLKSAKIEALMYASHIVNRLPASALDGKTPKEVWSGQPVSNYNRLHIFGCLAYFHVTESKLDPRAKKAIFVGFREGVEFETPKKSEKASPIADYPDDEFDDQDKISVEVEDSAPAEGSIELRVRHDLREAKKILSMEIKRDRAKGTICLTQTQYLKTVLQRFGINNKYKPVSTPLAPHFKLSALMSPTIDDAKRQMDHVPYVNVVGALMYVMVCTRPDISHAVKIWRSRRILTMNEATGSVSEFVGSGFGRWRKRNLRNDSENDRIFNGLE
ncbi:hypothetical protein EZV62_003480 [Acer yangbiense]|uniref:Reverse transcriptase Ty1/copia-type domain-containing protein n=1 Tax=Acer yangbiense TaxID=1000413 RepID=A0A5C7IHI9_9ROSI|nr:hypothetical protein EZV62_003480 [Acer yangbiense]